MVVERKWIVQVFLVAFPHNWSDWQLHCVVGRGASHGIPAFEVVVGGDIQIRNRELVDSCNHQATEKDDVPLLHSLRLVLLVHLTFILKINLSECIFALNWSLSS